MHDPTPDRVWRSPSALVERLNQGAKTPTFTIHSLRHYIRTADKNGLAPGIRRLGLKILVDEKYFFDWIEKGGANGNP